MLDPWVFPYDKPFEIIWKVWNTAWLGAQWTDYSGEHPNLIHFMYFFMTLFQLILLLNLLIAIMGDTFGRVKEGQIVEFYKNFASLIHEHEVLMSATELNRVDHFPRYMLYSVKEGADGAGDGPEDERAVAEEVARPQSSLDTVMQRVSGIETTLKHIREELKAMPNTSNVNEAASQIANVVMRELHPPPPTQGTQEQWLFPKNPLGGRNST